MLEKVKSVFPLIEAAGGMVKSNEGLFLFIFRRKKWDLPKGKLEPGENYKSCALREVSEECNLHIND
ncbi:MAG: NUDIX domain-containing protein, partial [Bacteroidales bacterium]